MNEILWGKRMVRIPCDEKFIQQYFSHLTYAKPLMESLGLLNGGEFQDFNNVVLNYLDSDDEERNFLLLNSFLSRENESESDFFDRYKKNLSLTAASGNPVSQFAVAESLEDSGNKPKAFEYYQLSAEKQFAPSMTNMGIMLIYGAGCTIDVKKGLSLLRKAKDLGDDIAKEFLVGYPYPSHNGMNRSID